MTVAFIKLSPPTILGIFASPPAHLVLENGNVVEGAAAGWTNGAYSLVSVAPFVPSAGQSITGSPSYSIDGSAVVTETYSTITTPGMSWPPIKIIKALQTLGKAKADLFINKMSSSDQARFMAAQSVAEDSTLLLNALAEPSVNIALADLKTAIAGLTGNGSG